MLLLALFDPELLVLVLEVVERLGDGRVPDPGVGQNLLQGGPALRVRAQAGPDEAHDGRRQLHVGPEGEAVVEDGIVGFEGNVADDHVVEQDPQRPHGRRDGVVGSGCYPLRGGVDPRAIEVDVGPVVLVHHGPGPEVDELQDRPVLAVEADEDVLILDVSVDHSCLVAILDRLHELLEQRSAGVFGDEFVFGDVIEQILAGFRPLEDQKVRVFFFDPVQQLDHVRDVRHAEQKSDFSGNSHVVNLQR